VKQHYQRIDAAARAFGVPEPATVAIGEVVADVREGLLAMAVGTARRRYRSWAHQVCAAAGLHELIMHHYYSADQLSPRTYSYLAHARDQLNPRR
jgi:hypothetical protein